MFIGCERGSYPDYYYIEDIESLEELQEYIQKSMPIMGRKVNHKYNSSAVLQEDTYRGLIYLNNYLNIYKSALYFIDQKRFEELKTNCKTCTNYNETWGCSSKYKPDDETICANYKAPKSKLQKNWFKFWR